MTDDPAVNAAQRALSGASHGIGHDELIAAAREALAPLRAKHQPRQRLDGSLRCTSCRDGDGAHADWPTGTDALRLTTRTPAMTDHPTDTDIITAHQAEYDDELDVTVCTCGDWTLNEDVIDYGAGVDEINRAKARQHAAHVADRLTAARTITTVDELDALPVGTVVMGADDMVLDHGATGEGDTSWYYGSDLEGAGGITLPARILYRPDSEDPS